VEILSVGGKAARPSEIHTVDKKNRQGSAAHNDQGAGQ
jgi:hypothetical protein